MRVIALRALREFWRRYPAAQKVLREWFAKVQAADWQSFADVNRTFNTADHLAVNGRHVLIFNVGGNRYRIVACPQYRWQMLYLRAVLTHTEYETNRWRNRI